MKNFILISLILFTILLSGCITVIKKETYMKDMQRLSYLKEEKVKLEENVAALEKKGSSTEADVEKLKMEKSNLEENLNKKETELFKKINEQGEVIAEKDKEIKRINKEKEELQQQMSRQINELNLKTKEMEIEINKLKMTKDLLTKDLKEEIDSKQIQIKMIRNKLSVNLVDKILFSTGKANLKETGKEVLKKVGRILKKIKDREIRIEGHTDNIPIGKLLQDQFPTNWELSTQRAIDVVRYLEEEVGIPGENLVAVGYGKNRPIGDNKTLKGRESNRRIEITIVPKDINRVVNEIMSTSPQKQEK